MTKTGRSKLEIIEAIYTFLRKEEKVFISQFKEIGLSATTAQEYIDLINYFALHHTEEEEIIQEKIGRITLTYLKEKPHD